MPAPQGRFFILTIKCQDYTPPTAIETWFTYLTGQKEIGVGGFEHWQLVVALSKKATITGCKSFFVRTAHVELTRSAAANDYVCKDDTAVPGTRFTLGALPVKLNSKVDWAKQLDLAKRGLEAEMDPGVYMRCYNTIKKIKAENMVAALDAPDVTGLWIWGPPGIGKSRLARDCYPGLYDKPLNKWWDGYSSNGPVLLDDVDKVHKVLGHHLKRWCDRYSFTAEVKGGTVSIRPVKMIITSNYSIEDIFGEDMTLVEAIRRRCTIIHMGINPFI